MVEAAHGFIWAKYGGSRLAILGNTVLPAKNSTAVTFRLQKVQLQKRHFPSSKTGALFALGSSMAERNHRFTESRIIYGELGCPLVI